MLKKIMYIGEDEKEEINIIKAVSFVGEETIKTVLDNAKTCTIRVDSEYMVKFIF